MEENRIIKNENTNWQCLNLRGGGILCSIAGKDITDGVDMGFNKVKITGYSKCEEKKMDNVIGNFKKEMICFFDDNRNIFGRMGDVDNYP
ncbi:MAG: hypothetical protein AABY22_02120 [Nanoarchaeota archaeon]